MSKCIIKEVALGVAKGSWSFLEDFFLLCVALAVMGVVFVLITFLLGHGFCTITGIYPAIEAASEIQYYATVGVLLIIVVLLATLLVGLFVTLFKVFYSDFMDIYRDAKRNCDH